ncbi:MAG: NADH-quinone oxidoreductase subunit B, partial [Bdellovibrionota bacterium]
MSAGGSSIYLSTIGKVLDWARSRSLWYVSTGAGCCADEVLDTMGCRYDLERFGCVSQVDPRQADLLIVSGMVSYKAAA